ncbi:YqjD family protein [Actibacterium sp. 188UL27-1]|uniref:DUF883 family protein n=1 Tax=Actibacterium sp. 188UL27-1 TaxID=2786961 RepID=UPI0019561C1A|nr:DUF883 family protein [Actibacterium sp. 188UL27-1]MBM7066862.1 DUF883 domain-containing protein [Actibacterium sp. 188UL27-1]
MATVKDMTSRTGSTDDVAKQISALKDDMASLTAALSNLIQTQGEAAKGRASAEIDAMARRGKDTAEMVANEAERLAAQTNDVIRQKPAMAVGIAAGVGFLIGLLSSRR